MTVIDKKKTSCVNFRFNVSSEAELLDIPSENSSVESPVNESIEAPRPRKRVKLNDSFHLSGKSHGRRKLQRLVNFTNLQGLNENEEIDLCNVQLMENYNSPLTQLFNNPLALQYWNQFIELSGEDQDRILDNLNSASAKKSQQNDDNYSIRRILAKIKKKFKIKDNLPVEIKNLELPLLDFFKSNKDGVYVFVPKSKLEKLLLHAIAQYHKFKLISDMQDSNKHFQIFIDDNWEPVEIEFFDVIQNKQNY